MHSLKAAAALVLFWVLQTLPVGAADCAMLSGHRIAPSEIALKTTGAEVTSAVFVDDQTNGRFCRVGGLIHPVDPSAPDIQFRLNLPERWNHKVVHFGGGGFDGSLVDGEGRFFRNPGSAMPIAQGYATFGSDSGHEATPKDPEFGRFALNAEALANFAGDQLKKTHDVALALIRLRYGAAPKRVYFQGNSQGGHEGFIVIQRWPQDYDGVVAIHPAYDLVALSVDGDLLGQAIYNQPGDWVSPSKMAALSVAVYRACDGLDGLVDGVIANVKACANAFHVQDLRCPGGADTGPDCLSDRQIQTLQTFNRDTRLGVTLQGGIDSLGRLPVFEGGDVRLFNVGPNPDPAKGVGAGYRFGQQMVRYIVMRDPSYEPLTFVPEDHAEVLKRLSAQIDASADDISPFERRGGKLLLMHGTSDMLVTPYNTIAYYDWLSRRFGQDRLRRFVRFYIAPGFGHGDGPFQVGWDSLEVLDAWVDHGRAPGPQIAVDTNRETAGRAMPLCEYPTWPRYDGHGDPKAATSFICVVR
jgi:feruloyl esterase